YRGGYGFHPLLAYCDETGEALAGLLRPGNAGSNTAADQIAEITSLLDLSAWPTGSRVIVRRERAHPGAQLSFTDHDGHRFQATLTDQDDPDIQTLERRHRQRARCEDHIRNDKDTGLRNMPFRDFEHNRVWLMLVLFAHDLLAWTQRLTLTGELARCEPKRLRYRLLHVAARLAFHARAAILRIDARWRWRDALIDAFKRARALPAPA
ncbi:MAG: transposase, partial [Actinobacteria bacterium]|nr:transposase [Actinomycetota bacterium]